MSKKEPKVKHIHGTSIMHIDGHDSWLTCILDTGEKVTISFTVLFKFFDNYDLKVREFGVGSDNPRWRTINFEPRIEELSPLKLIEKLS
jgi:hypothetical protein